MWLLFSSLSVMSNSLWPPWTAGCVASLSLAISWSLPKFTSTAAVVPSSRLTLWCPLLLLPSTFPSIRDFSNQSAVRIRWPKYWSFTFSKHQSFQWVFRVDFLKDWLVWTPCCPRDSHFYITEKCKHTQTDIKKFHIKYFLTCRL